MKKKGKKQINEKKIVVVGDGMVGKTSLVMSFQLGRFPKEEGLLPTVCDSYQTTITTKKKEQINIEVWDTPGEPLFKRIRCLTYFNADLFILCYSISDPQSFINIRNTWIPEITQHSPSVPFILVGLKRDIRENKSSLSELKDSGYEAITTDEGKAEAVAVGAMQFFECSALEWTNVKPLFEYLSSSLSTDDDNNTSAMKMMTIAGDHKRHNSKCSLL